MYRIYKFWVYVPGETIESFDLRSSLLSVSAKAAVRRSLVNHVHIMHHHCCDLLCADRISEIKMWKTNMIAALLFFNTR